MRKLLSVLPLVAVLAAPAVMHADAFTGQFSVTGDLYQNSSTQFQFIDANVGKASGQSGSFATLFTAGETVGASSQYLNFNPYTAGSEIFTIGNVSINLQSFTQTSAGMFNGLAILSDAKDGYTDTNAYVQFTTQQTSDPTVSVTFSSTVNASPVPEPSTLALLGTGGLSLAGAIRRRFRA